MLEKSWRTNCFHSGGVSTHTHTHYLFSASGLSVTHCFPLVVVRQSYSKLFKSPTTEKKTEEGKGRDRRYNKTVQSEKSKEKQKGRREEELGRKSREGGKDRKNTNLEKSLHESCGLPFIAMC